ncbi:hypothetical protein [Leadbettera azotonutricia]|uniref:Putative lipoprotein n=1 Tax=Leadbettera azotonutricia (strain ATCC BAA-888 / DSM 13862 / ZAS-9) TaxID=545695 RepID=F5Y8M2_LEAAZ|nr:hypothetical protein [Leadbettera azotonutricia]AEF81010.1 putative lipoprotein [Leadbettera azotonutricia ZAS-9]
MNNGYSKKNLMKGFGALAMAAMIGAAGLIMTACDGPQNPDNENPDNNGNPETENPGNENPVLTFPNIVFPTVVKDVTSQSDVTAMNVQKRLELKQQAEYMKGKFAEWEAELQIKYDALTPSEKEAPGGVDLGEKIDVAKTVQTYETNISKIITKAIDTNGVASLIKVYSKMMLDETTILSNGFLIITVITNANYLYSLLKSYEQQTIESSQKTNLWEEIQQKIAAIEEMEHAIGNTSYKIDGTPTQMIEMLRYQYHSFIDITTTGIPSYDLLTQLGDISAYDGWTINLAEMGYDINIPAQTP